jgi:hypothetical protein
MHVGRYIFFAVSILFFFQTKKERSTWKVLRDLNDCYLHVISMILIPRQVLSVEDQMQNS